MTSPTLSSVVAGTERIPFLPHLQPQLKPDFNHKDLELKEITKRRSRTLESNDYFESLLVDKNGNEYEPYSLAWRYLGMYLDCDDDINSDENRRLSGDDGGDCDRTLLWAAYVDPRYRGGTIGEYQFYDLSTETWDASTCKTRHCSRMDCHEPGTHFRLVGTFKETDGLYDFAEQLFKHEGYCVWDSDTYEVMETYLEKWPSSCNQLYYSDADGNTIYMNTKPLEEGNITIGIYLDEKCSLDANLTLSEYIMIYYSNYGNEDQGAEVAATWEEAIETWNEGMSAFKICQPCRAYNLFKNNDYYEPEENGRYLNDGDENDGEGEEEQWGYNCYDDAGYTNVNQCYKFEVKTDMEAAEIEDLARASRQGTILQIKVDGKVFGNGGFRSPLQPSKVVAIITIITAAVIIVGGIYFLMLNSFLKRLKIRREVHTLPPSLREKLDVNSEDDASTAVEVRYNKDGNDGEQSVVEENTSQPEQNE